MKTTKITSGLVIALAVPFLMGCPKQKNALAPEPDTELQSSVDASFANFVVTDIDMLCSFVGEDDLRPDFYTEAPNEAPVAPPVRYDNESRISVYYNSNRCVDGMLRDGTIYLHYENANPNAGYYRNYEFKGRLELLSYKVNGWTIKLEPGTECYIYNKRSSPANAPSQEKLSWLIEGSFEFIHPSDPSRNMTWKGAITKTLANTNDPAVYNPTGQAAIAWSRAKVEYSGEISGVTNGNVPYKMVINKAHPLTREFGCYPNSVGGVTSVQPFRTWSEEFHPFKTGIVSFTTGNKYPREIYYGNEGNPELAEQCDNSGQVLIKGNAYPVDFLK